MAIINKMMAQDSPVQMYAEFDGDINKVFNSGKEGDMPILTTRNMVNFPGVLASVTIARPSTRKLVKYIERHPKQQFAMFCQKDASIEEPTAEDLNEYGVVAQFLKAFELPGQDGRYAFIAQALTRCHITDVITEEPYLKAHVEIEKETLPADDDLEFQTMMHDLRSRVKEYIDKSDAIPFELQLSLHGIDDPTFFVNMVSYHMPFSLQEKMSLLNNGDIKLRALSLLQLINREIQYANLRLDIQNRTQHTIDEEQKHYFLRQQMKSISKELGSEYSSPEKARLHEKAKQKKWTEEIRESFEQELERLDQLHPQSSDYNVQLTYLQHVVSLPWGEETKDDLDIRRAEKILNRDHYGMKSVKERILEYIAVLALRKHAATTGKTPILCLYGPPGVGKTSLGKSIATALRRKYIRISLGGLHDEAEIRGHRRTYVGAMPGRIIKGIEKAATSNPVFVLDEIDKISPMNNNGDPASALLEVLDPEQNNAFHDNFLDLDYDLSKVLFIATANDISTIPTPLLDRMELIEVTGYTTEEKTEIARRHLLPKEMEQTGFATAAALPTITKASLQTIIEEYTRESGVRQLQREINKLLRKLAYQKAMNAETTDNRLNPNHIREILGKPPYHRDQLSDAKTGDEKENYAGVATGLAWTRVGGEILFIETSLSRSKTPKLTVTGNLGDVMKESAAIALQYVKAHAESHLHIEESSIFDNYDIHVHVPEGATPKDGPSAGITIATSIASAITGRKILPLTAMTGEITLRGKVLPVGGIREKILAAKRAGAIHIILCKANQPDVEQIPEEHLKGVTFHYVDNVADVWQIALCSDGKA